MELLSFTFCLSSVYKMSRMLATLMPSVDSILALELGESGFQLSKDIPETTRDKLSTSRDRSQESCSGSGVWREEKVIPLVLLSLKRSICSWQGWGLSDLTGQQFLEPGRTYTGVRNKWFPHRCLFIHTRGVRSGIHKEYMDC
jgi:hypothetical protein